MSTPNGAHPAEAAAPPKPTLRERVEQVSEILLAVIMGTVALATAWSGYQAAGWGAQAAADNRRASAMRAESLRASTRAGQQAQIDVSLFGNWVDAYARGDMELAQFYQDRFRDEFKPAFEAWVALEPLKNPDAPAAPFYMPEYRLAAAIEAARLEDEVAASTAAAEEANQRGDAYVLNTLILASVLFLAGVAPKFRWSAVRMAVVFIAFGLLCYGLYNLATYPIA